MSEEKQIRVIEVVPHNSNWKGEFYKEAERIRNTMKDEIVGIHHIGSTSIPGIYAKPVIDILAEVKDISKVDDYNSRMQELGYIAKGEFGINGRRFFIKGLYERTHHIHVFQTGNPEIARHLRFRDYMIAHPDDARAYEELKKELACKYRYDPAGYVDGKDTFIKEVDRKAEEWARVMGNGTDIRSKLIYAIQRIAAEESSFLLTLSNKHEAVFGSYNNWTYKDTIAHNSEWRYITTKKLQLIKNNECVQFREQLEMVNRNIYDKHSEDTDCNIKDLSERSNHSLIQSIERFSNLELQSEGKLMGFIGPLWKYINYYGAIHPIKHLVFYYLKTQSFMSAFQTLKEHSSILAGIDDSKDTMSKYLEFAYFFDGMVNKDEVFSNLKNFFISNATNHFIDDELLQQFITINNIYN